MSIRIKFKTKDENGFYNMNLLNRICVLKEERSIYKVSGYNFDDIDWDHTCVDIGKGWQSIGRDFIEEIIS